EDEVPAPEGALEHQLQQTVAMRQGSRHVEVWMTGRAGSTWHLAASKLARSQELRVPRGVVHAGEAPDVRPTPQPCAACGSPDEPRPRPAPGSGVRREVSRRRI